MSLPEGRQEPEGFTLVEMLAVMAVIVVLLALLGPPVASMVRGPLLTQAADQVVGLLNLAQQTAVTRNQSVAVRFYQYADTAAGESTADPTSWKFYGMQLFLVDDNGAATPLQAVTSWPAGIIADSGTTLSTLLVGTQQKTNWSTGAPADPQVSLPRAGTAYHCYEFRFRPDGSTNLSPTSPTAGNSGYSTNGWFITLHNRINGDTRTTPPADYVTVQIDPVSGASTVYRP